MPSGQIFSIFHIVRAYDTMPDEKRFDVVGYNIGKKPPIQRATNFTRLAAIKG